MQARKLTRTLSTEADHSSSSSSSTSSVLPFSLSSLGLQKTFLSPSTLTSIRQLPEVEAALQSFPSSMSLDQLHRASDVFSSFAKGGKEHLAVCALSAECQQQLASYDQAAETLDRMYDLSPTASNTVSTTYAAHDLILAQAKVLWSLGDFATSQGLCESVIGEYDDLRETFPTTNLHIASAMTGKALCQLSSMKSMEDAYSVRDYFRITIKFLERHPPTSNPLPIAAAHLNGGLAEAIYAMFLEETNKVSVPIKSAMKIWFQGLQSTELRNTIDSKPNWVDASKELQAHLNGNLAWGILRYETDRSDRISKASEYAGKALAALDSSSKNVGGNNTSDGLCRTLTILASCYHHAGKAVTAEGLLQSAIDKKKSAILLGTQSKLALKDAFLSYSKLCSDWEKREGDAQRLQDAADEVDKSLPDAWKGKDGILSALWFWTPGDFL